ncbi:U3 small nucleolar RNA-associated protein MPP10 [Smittium culicis]|uniref:U3 small nucleolar ribonucleoprotein protein MPP10 n=1 Tax=Smittium culicis TaxID=133412 RepID=A0A1R1XH84_9FUNG|nr:U3 small nucleolar RNA-associated protein MPP10 [Smittium culicis]
MENFMLNFPLQPEDYFSPDKKIKEKCFNLSKAAFDLGNKNVCYGTLKELLGENDGFTQAEQIWELIQLRNKSVLSHAKQLLDDIPQNYNSILSESFSQDSDSGEDSLYSDDYSEDSESEAVAHPDNDQFIDSENAPQNLEEDSDLNSESEINQDNELDLPDSEHDSDMENDSEISNSGSESKTLSDNDLSDLDDLEQHGELEKEKKKSNKKSVVDDDFFSLDQMHKFVEEAEQSEMRDRMILAGEGDPFESKNDKLNSDESSSEDEDDDLNYFEDMDEFDEEDEAESDMDPSKIKYDDFFKPVTTSKRAIAKESRESHAKRSKFDPKSYKNSEKNAKQIEKSDNESDNDAEAGGEYGLNEDDNDLDIQESENDLDDSSNNKSTFEIYQQKLNSQISQLEKDAVTKKDWVMTGEVTSRLRPIDSLLGEHLDYDYVQKPVPIITQQVTESLEELIKRRILASEYNDVVRKKQDLDQDYFRSSRVDLDDAAPKKSLAEVYEQEYLEQRENSSSHLPGGKKSIYTDTELELHKEISSMMKSLTYTLDSLTNFYYTPKVKTANAEIRVDAPAIEMEEALPVKVSSVSQLAPEEIYSNISGKSSKVSKTGKKSLIDNQQTHIDDGNEEVEGEESSFANQTDIVSFGLGTGEIKGASEATEADRRRWRAMKKKAFKKSNSGKPQKSTDNKSK